MKWRLFCRRLQHEVHPWEEWGESWSGVWSEWSVSRWCWRRGSFECRVEMMGWLWVSGCGIDWVHQGFYVSAIWWPGGGIFAAERKKAWRSSGVSASSGNSEGEHHALRGASWLGLFSHSTRMQERRETALKEMAREKQTTLPKNVRWLLAASDRWRKVSSAQTLVNIEMRLSWLRCCLTPKECNSHWCESYWKPERGTGYVKKDIKTQNHYKENKLNWEKYSMSTP